MKGLATLAEARVSRVSKSAKTGSRLIVNFILDEAKVCDVVVVCTV
jgi:hypothetical protein